MFFSLDCLGSLPTQAVLRKARALRAAALLASDFIGPDGGHLTV